MFDPAEKAIGPVQVEYLRRLNEFEVGQCLQCIQRARFLQKRVAAAMDELQRLYHEFDFPNAAASEFDVSVQVFGRIVFDPALDAGNFVEQIRGGASRIDKWLMLAQKFVGQFPTAGDAAGFD